MRLICFWCVLLAVSARAQENPYYAPQTFRQQADLYNRQLFSPSNDVNPQGSSFPAGNSAPVYEQWRGSGPINPPKPLQPSPIKLEPWRAPFQVTKEQQAAILHHKQALSSEGSFRFEYASDNGLAAGEVIEPDGSRVGAYQYKDPSGQLVKLKYRAGKDGFQILEGSHIPKSPEPVPPSSQDNHYQQAYAQQRQQYELQQQYNQQRPQQNWNQNQQQQQQGEQGQKGAAGQYFVQNWRPGPLGPGQEDDGQYRENEVDNQGPHNFGEGYAFAFQG